MPILKCSTSDLVSWIEGFLARSLMSNDFSRGRRPPGIVLFLSCNLLDSSSYWLVWLKIFSYPLSSISFPISLFKLSNSSFNGKKLLSYLAWSNTCEYLMLSWIEGLCFPSIYKFVLPLKGILHVLSEVANASTNTFRSLRINDNWNSWKQCKNSTKTLLYAVILE